MSQPRPMQPCPVERPQAGWAGTQGFTTRDHSWPSRGIQALARCHHCNQTRTEASSPEHEPLEHTPNPDRWNSVTRLLSTRP